MRVTPMLRKSRYEALEHAREGLIRLRNLPRRLKRRLYEKKIGRPPNQPASAGSSSAICGCQISSATSSSAQAMKGRAAW